MNACYFALAALAFLPQLRSHDLGLKFWGWSNHDSFTPYSRDANTVQFNSIQFNLVLVWISLLVNLLAIHLLSTYLYRHVFAPHVINPRYVTANTTLPSPSTTPIPVLSELNYNHIQRLIYSCFVSLQNSNYCICPGCNYLCVPVYTIQPSWHCTLPPRGFSGMEPNKQTNKAHKKIIQLNKGKKPLQYLKTIYHFQLNRPLRGSEPDSIGIRSLSWRCRCSSARCSNSASSILALLSSRSSTPSDSKRTPTPLQEDFTAHSVILLHLSHQFESNRAICHTNLDKSGQLHPTPPHLLASLHQSLSQCPKLSSWLLNTSSYSYAPSRLFSHDY